MNDCCSLDARELSEAEATGYALTFKTLGDPMRLLILSHIAQRDCSPVTVTELAEKLRLSQPTVSHHLKKLAEASLVTRTKTGRTVTHHINPDTVQRLRTILELG